MTALTILAAPAGAKTPTPGDAGTVTAWGENGDGQVSGATGVSSITAIDAGESHSLALRSNGTVAAWGENFSGQSTVPPTLSGVTAIAGGHLHSLAVPAAGAVEQTPCPTGTESSTGAVTCTPIAGSFNSNFDGSAVLRVKPNQAIPLRWAFPDGTSNRALLAGTVSLTSVTSTRCTAVGGIDGIEPGTSEGVTGASGLQLLADGSYQVNWKATSTTGCRALTVTAPYAAGSGFSGSWSRTILVDIKK